jgi:hypothetical protein
MSWVMRMEQNFGPHIEQKCAVLCASLGRVSSWNFSAVAGSSDRLNWSIQRNSKRALESASSRSARGMALGEVGGVGGDLVGDDADLHVVAIGSRCSLGVT